MSTKDRATAAPKTTPQDTPKDTPKDTPEIVEVPNCPICLCPLVADDTHPDAPDVQVWTCQSCQDEDAAEDLS